MSNQKTTDIQIKWNADFNKKIKQEFIASNMLFLCQTFQKDYVKYFPTNILDETTLLRLINLSQALKNLKGCQGYDNHIKEYKNDIESTYFVALVANYLNSKVDNLFLEPDFDGVSKKSDILVSLNQQKIFFECKAPKKNVLTDLEQEHEFMYSILSSCISKPSDVTITYIDAMNEPELHKLGNFLKEMLPRVTQEGILLSKKDLKVEVTNIRDKFIDIGDIKIAQLWENYYENEQNPGTIINRNGKALAFIKKDVSFQNNLRVQLKNSRKKASHNSPYVICIHNDNISGSISKNINFISSLFKPNMNTSVTGVLLIRYLYSFNNLIHYDFKFVSNPYAKNPYHGISNLFMSNYPY